MLSKCANPGCPAPFLYLHQGRLFRFDFGSDSPAGQSGRNLEFFWLCDQCATKADPQRSERRGSEDRTFTRGARGQEV
jgi:hypothetical protein